MDLKSLELNIPLNTIRKGSMDSLIGEIFVKFDDICFPRPGWRDIVDAILLHWIGDIWIHEEFNLNNQRKIHLPFMGGPFEITLTQIDGEIFHCLLENRYRDNAGNNDFDVVGEFHINLSVLKEHIKFVCREIIRYCKDQKLFSEDIKSLNLRLLNIDNEWIE